MSIINIFSGVFCKEEDIIRKLLDNTKYSLVSENDIITRASILSGMAESRIKKTFTSKTSVFNRFTHEKERSLAYLKLAVAETIAGDEKIIAGFAGQLIPSDISHVLRICLIADMKYRSSLAAEKQGLSEKESIIYIHKFDENCVLWIKNLFDKDDPWDSSLYDIVIPMDKMSIDEAADLIEKNAAADVVQATEISKKKAEDFLLSAKVEVALTKSGHNAEVSSADGVVLLTINRHVLRLSRLEEELKSIAGKVPGVKSVETKIGKKYYQADVYRKCDFKMPAKVLVVDDERDFAQTLSERLLLRDMGSAVAYDGESALNIVHEDEPEVMILDLKMPGINGIEVLRKVKESRPEIEVIILTGHGSEEDRKLCKKLGAFAYLQKPVDIELLSSTLKKANEKIQKKAGLSGT